MDEEVKVLNVSVEPVKVTGTVNQCLQDTAQVISNVMESFEEPTEKEQKATSFLNTLKGYVQSEEFKADVNASAKKYGVPPKKIAQNFFEKALGTVGDILGVAVSVICNAGHMVVNLANTVCHSIVNLIQSIASGIVSIVTFNKTCAVN